MASSKKRNYMTKTKPDLTRPVNKKDLITELRTAKRNLEEKIQEYKDAGNIKGVNRANDRLSDLKKTLKELTQKTA